MIKIIVFGIIALLIFQKFRPALGQPSGHGFYVFFAFESLLVLSYLNIRWGEGFAGQWIPSAILLVASALMAMSGFRALKKHGNAVKDWEDTTRLIDRGIFRHIRHPLFASLMLLAIGILIKDVTGFAALACFMTLLFLFLASRVEEKENLAKFGDPYRTYQEKTKRYLPFLI
jgi:protein-S-isoprenylcysteine O-methyltransferase Ste14